MMRVRKELEFMFDLGDLGLRNGRILADVDGARVTLVAAMLSNESENILPLLRLSTREKIKERLRDLSGVNDAVYDWDNPPEAS